MSSFESTSTEIVGESSPPLDMTSLWSQMPTQTLRATHHQGPRVTPNASFEEMDSNESSPNSLPHMIFAEFNPMRSSSGQQNSAWSPTSNRTSVGLPSLYPGYHRSSTLAEEAVLEELQDFEELFDRSCYSSAMNASNVLGKVTYTGNSPQRFVLTTSVRDSPFDNDDRSPPPSPPRRGHHRRSQNRARDQEGCLSLPLDPTELSRCCRLSCMLHESAATIMEKARLVK
jgi:hypothetical protein